MLHIVAAVLLCLNHTTAVFVFVVVAAVGVGVVVVAVVAFVVAVVVVDTSGWLVAGSKRAKNNCGCCVAVVFVWFYSFTPNYDIKTAPMTTTTTTTTP